MKVEVSFKTPRSAEDAFAYIARDFFENHQRWDPAIVELRRHADGPVGEGTTGTEVRKFGGKQSADFKVTRFEQARRFEFSNTTGDFWLDRAYAIEPNGEGTRISFTFDMRPRTGKAKVIFPLVQKTIAKQVRNNIARLSEQLS